jgi:hypothetical protein
LGETRVTDAGLEHLKGLIGLEFLHLRNTNVTQEGVEELKKALPNLIVRLDHASEGKKKDSGTP